MISGETKEIPIQIKVPVFHPGEEKEKEEEEEKQK